MIADFNLSQIHMVETPVYPMARIDEGLIYKDDKNIKLLEKNMNEQDIADVRDVIENVMTSYLFELADQKTMDAITAQIATEMHIEEYYDYVLEANVHQDNIVIDLCVKTNESDDFLHFSGSYADCPSFKHDNDTSTLEHKETKIAAYERAMKGI